MVFTRTKQEKGKTMTYHYDVIAEHGFWAVAWPFFVFWVVLCVLAFFLWKYIITPLAEEQDIITGSAIHDEGEEIQ